MFKHAVHFFLLFLCLNLIFSSHGTLGPDRGSLVRVPWTITPLEAFDLGIGAEGDLFAIGLDEKIYYHSFLLNSYLLVDGNFELSNPRRIDTDDDGTPYVVEKCGDVYYLDLYNNWIKLPGCATDIGVGRGGDIWKVGCDNKPHGGYGIWKLVCNKCLNCDNEREIVRFRKMSYTPNKYKKKLFQEDRNCFWTRIEGEALRVDVSPEGWPYIIAPGNFVMKYEQPVWLAIQGKLGKDLTVSNEGLLFIIDLEGDIYRGITEELGSWEQIEGNAIAISAGPYSQPAIISKEDHIVKISSKFTYN